MKIRAICFFTASLFFALPSFGQWAAGINAGSSILYPGFLTVNIAVEKELAPSLYLRSGAGFTLRGNRALVRKVELDADISSASSSYWSLPVQLKGQLELKKIHLYGLAGVELGVGHKVYYLYTKENSLYNGKSSFRNFGLRPFDIGVSAGFGFQHLAGKGRIVFVDYQFYLGLIDLDPSEAITIFNESQGISVGLLIPISIKSAEE
jgi:hypothetical protein